MAITARKLRQLVESCGLVVDRVDMSFSHPRVHVKAPDGRCAFFVFPRSTSDHRARANQRAKLKAFAQGRWETNTRRGERQANG